MPHSAQMTRPADSLVPERVGNWQEKQRGSFMQSVQAKKEWSMA
jgi:hypothetical protein